MPESPNTDVSGDVIRDAYSRSTSDSTNNEDERLTFSNYLSRIREYRDHMEYLDQDGPEENPLPDRPLTPEQMPTPLLIEVAEMADAGMRMKDIEDHTENRLGIPISGISLDALIKRNLPNPIYIDKEKERTCSTCEYQGKQQLVALNRNFCEVCVNKYTTNYKVKPEVIEEWEAPENEDQVSNNTSSTPPFNASDLHRLRVERG